MIPISFKLTRRARIVRLRGHCLLCDQYSGLYKGPDFICQARQAIGSPSVVIPKSFRSTFCLLTLVHWYVEVDMMLVFMGLLGWKPSTTSKLKLRVVLRHSPIEICLLLREIDQELVFW